MFVKNICEPRCITSRDKVYGRRCNCVHAKVIERLKRVGNARLFFVGPGLKTSTVQTSGDVKPTDDDSSRLITLFHRFERWGGEGVNRIRKTSGLTNTSRRSGFPLMLLLLLVVVDCYVNGHALMCVKRKKENGKRT